MGLIKVSRGPARQMAMFPTPLPHGESKGAERCLSPTAMGGWGGEDATVTPTPCHLSVQALPPRDLKGLEVKASVKILSQRVVQGCTVPLCSLSTHCQPKGLANGGHSDDPPLPSSPPWAHLPTQPEADSQQQSAKIW